MKRIRFLTLLGCSLAALSARESLAQDPASTIQFITTGTGDWNTALNWEALPPDPPGNFVPGDGFPGEVATISNGGTATLTAPALNDITGLVIGQSGFGNSQGTLNFSGTGALIATGAVRVGNNGLGVVNMTGGSLTVGELRVGGAGNSAVNLSGNASVSADIARLQRITRITGPNVGFEVASELSVGGTFIAEITGANHSVIDATGIPATVSGALQVSYNGPVPAFGKTWTLIDAGSVNGQFASVDFLGTPTLPRGGAFDVRYNTGGNGNVEVAVGNRLVLTVDRASGATRIENPLGAPIVLNGYDISSANGLLSPAEWDSLSDTGIGGAGWQEANPAAEHLSELNLLGSHSIAVSASRNLGEAYLAGAIRRQDEDLVFQYSTPDGRVLDGIVEYLGAVNDLVLKVDPATGEAALQNLSPHVSFNIKGYDITSASGSLSAAGWTSFQDTGDAGPNWFEANPSPNHLSELNLLSSTNFTSGVQVHLGDIFSNGGTRDLVLQFVTTSGEVLEGTVEYGTIDEVGQEGDTNGDGLVNLDDLNAVRNNFGGSGAPGIPGDSFPFDGVVDLDDLNAVRNNFGAGSSQSVPEPSAALLGLVAIAALGGWRRVRNASSAV
jgi:hypothetical protein